MKKPSGKIRLAIIASLGFAVPALAFDATTVAFYPFTEGTAGDSAVGTTVRNAADTTAYAGTPSLSADASLARVAFSDDAPAKYIFSGMGGAPIATNVHSLLFNGTMVRKSLGTDGANVAFEGLGTALSACDEYTVEFFWKVCEEDTPGIGALIATQVYSPSCLSVADGSHTATGSNEGTVNLNLPESPTMCRFWIGGGVNTVNTKVESILYDTYSGYKVSTILDGKWHHIAITHSKAKNLTRLIADYTDQVCPTCRNGANRGPAVTNETLMASCPFNLGNFTYHGKIAGLRVTSRVLGTDGLLHASNDEHFFTDMGDTICHWRCEGTDGAAVVALTNAVAVTDFHEANPDLFYFKDTWIVSTTYTGEGAPNVGSAHGSARPVYTNELPHARNRSVCDGASWGDALGDNAHALALIPPTYNESAVFQVQLPNTEYRNFTNGDFTVECFCRFDADLFKEMGAPVEKGIYPGSNIMQADTPSTDRVCDWQFRFDFQPNSDGTAWQYMRPVLGAYKMVGSSPSFMDKSLGYGGPSFKFWKGEWMHFALVFEDKAPYRLKFYYDHQLQETLDLGEYRLRYGSNRTYTFGNRAPFLFDEIRISRKALKPEEFLHLNHKRSGCATIVK